MRNFFRTLAIVIGAGIIAAFVIVRLTAGGPGVAASVSNSPTNQFTQSLGSPDSNATAPQVKEWPGDGDHDGFTRRGSPAAAGTVKQINGSTLTLATPDGKTINVTVTSNTAYLRGDVSTSLSAIHSGDKVFVVGSQSSGGSVAATKVIIVEPHIFGTVASVNGSTFTVTTMDPDKASSKTVTVSTSGSTIYRSKPGTAAGLSSVTKGESVIVEGTLSADGLTMQADRVLILPSGGLMDHLFHGGFGLHGFFHGLRHQGDLDNSIPGSHQQGQSNGPNI